MIEICLDIGKHIIADEKFCIPEDSKDIFPILNEEGILSDPLLPIMTNRAGFRNLIVHLYEKIDLEIVTVSMQSISPILPFCFGN